LLALSSFITDWLLKFLVVVTAIFMTMVFILMRALIGAEITHSLYKGVFG
jgi:hypothetical protein